VAASARSVASVQPESGSDKILFAVALMGVGSAVFHPEASRIARMASGGRHGLAQLLFSVGGNAGSSMGPLLAAFIVLPKGQRRIGWFSLVAILAMALLAWVSVWYKARSTAAIALPTGTRNVCRRVRQASGICHDDPHRAPVLEIFLTWQA
jgi:MFS family permease